MAYEKFTFWDWDKNPEMEGTLIGQYRSIGRFKKNAFSFKLENNAVVNSWAYAELFRQLYGIPFGTVVYVRYLGMDEAPDTGYKVKAFEVQVVAPPNQETVKKK